MRKLLRGLFWTAAFLGVFGLIARYTFLDVWKIPDEANTTAISMEPTLSGGDTVLLITWGEPSFGDVVRCHDPEAAPTENVDVVGRVAGLSSDTVEIQGHDLVVGGAKYIGEMACPEERRTLVHPVSGEEIPLACDQVQMGGRIHYRGHSLKAQLISPIKAHVGAGMLFLLSDNRSYPDDSRKFGTVPASTCKGRVFFRLWGRDGWADSKKRLSYIR
jgi:signal peptidase I